jgi:hypothetical protein
MISLDTLPSRTATTEFHMQHRKDRSTICS